MDTGKIGIVAEVAKSAKQKSAQALKASQQAHRQKCDQLEQLQQFKREYESRLEVLGGQGIAARQLQDYRQFLSKLNQAIEQQKEEIHSAARNLEASRKDWVSGSRRSSALDQVVDQQKLRDRQARDRAEQKESDEMSLARSSGQKEA